ncbi:uroporphyrinogen-III synthase [Aquimarina sp. MMG016]|uniref:uroporphyrinogen-III synthase n=1 Tax=Aquimarina sp. MMG016 TaxID=2822690 RepID=UPI001B3A6681|nr:uroporphyrinogen-III synthase [Aquimarina sp. MMG016]MBQ4822057.1 uroporphyrinogen-III synthase [Aquimarina sp. MMG016]
MSSGSTILSTKKLTVAQKELLLNSGIGFVEFDAIQIEFLEVTNEKEVENAIFTSKNAVKAIKNSGMNISNCFCVGANTKNFLEENGQKVLETAQNASDLAEIIVENYKNESFLFFCGNLRRDELPGLLKLNNVQLKEQIVYNTYLSSKKFDRVFDGILFFSPSEVQSYVEENQIGDSIAFCIGNTTASEVKKYTRNIVIANKPTVENVIVQVVKTLGYPLERG